MSDQESWEERYRTGSIPWDLGRPDSNLTDMVKHNFTVTATDVSELAIQKAKERASDAGVGCTFLVADFLNDKVPGAPFGFVFDRGCFHSFDADEERKQFAENVAFHLAKDGLWLSLVGSTDGPPRDVGPPQRSARDIVIAMEPYFEILLLKSTHFDSNDPEPPRAWICMMQKREP
jgi:hypothetical protein